MRCGRPSMAAVDIGAMPEMGKFEYASGVFVSPRIPDFHR